MDLSTYVCYDGKLFSYRLLSPSVVDSHVPVYDSSVCKGFFFYTSPKGHLMNILIKTPPLPSPLPIFPFLVFFFFFLFLFSPVRGIKHSELDKRL